MSNTQILIFSKDRTLQLNSLIQSLLYFSDVLEDDISVLFKSNKEISYEMLMDKYKCTYQEEKSLLNDVKIIVQSKQKKNCMF